MPDRAILMKLRATASVTAKCGSATSIRGGELDRSDTLPGIVVSRETKRPVNTAGGTDATKFATVFVECIGTTYDAAIALADAAEAALNGYTNAAGTPAISMVHVVEIGYAPGTELRGRDGVYENFVLNCLVQYSA